MVRARLGQLIEYSESGWHGPCALNGKQREYIVYGKGQELLLLLLHRSSEDSCTALPADKQGKGLLGSGIIPEGGFPYKLL